MIETPADTHLEPALHDLLGTLSALVLWQELLRDRVEDPVRREEALDAIRSCVDRLARSLRDVFDVGRAPGRLR